MKLVPRLSQDRGHADHGWLKTFHTFSFAMYQDDRFDQFGALRVINEGECRFHLDISNGLLMAMILLPLKDRVASTQGFGTHAHREFEIFSYSECHAHRLA